MIISLVLTIGVPYTGMANKVLEITDNFEFQYVGEYLETCGDVEEGYSINEAVKATTWKTQNSSKFMIQTSTEYIWMKFTVKNQTNIAQDFSLVLEDPFMETVQFFSFEKNQLLDTSMIMGTAFPFEQRIIQHRFPIYPFQLTIDQQKTIYLVLKNDEAFTPIHLSFTTSSFSNLFLREFCEAVMVLPPNT